MVCLLARTLTFLFLIWYALSDPSRFFSDLDDSSFRFTPLTAVWLFLMSSILVRFFPSKVESLGCQKEFGKRHQSTDLAPRREDIQYADRGALRVLVLWILLNGLFFACWFKGWLDNRFLICLAGFYGVCDIFFILFFCPLQVWFMRNRCCITCRIYNWDYLMICTPLLPIGSIYTITAFVLSFVLFLRWEILYRRHQARFFERSNQALKCSHCQEKLCRYKITAIPGNKLHLSRKTKS